MAIYVNRGQAKHSFVGGLSAGWEWAPSVERTQVASVLGAVQGSEGPGRVIIPTAPKEREGCHGK